MDKESALILCLGVMGGGIGFCFYMAQTTRRVWWYIYVGINVSSFLIIFLSLILSRLGK